MKSLQRFGFALICLGFVIILSACQLRDNRQNLHGGSATAAVQPLETQAPSAAVTDQPTLLAAAFQEDTPQPTSTTVAPVTPDPAAQDLDDLLNQLNQMNQSGDAFDDLP